MNSLYGINRQISFSDAFEDANTFLDEWKESGLYKSGLVADSSILTLYYLLYGRYGNSTISSSDTNRFKYQLWGITFQYAPTWEKKLDIQSKLRSLTEDELATGSKAIYNRAENAQTSPDTDTLEELPYINEQNTTGYKKSKMDRYAQLYSLLEDDVTDAFLKKFQKLFKIVAMPEDPLLYFEEDK